MAKDDDFVLNNRALYALQAEIAEQSEKNRILMAQSILTAFQAHDADGTLWQLIDEMLKQDHSLVSRLEFIINSAVQDAALEEKGGRYAN